MTTVTKETIGAAHDVTPGKEDHEAATNPDEI